MNRTKRILAVLLLLAAFIAGVIGGYRFFFRNVAPKGVRGYIASLFQPPTTAPGTEPYGAWVRAPGTPSSEIPPDLKEQMEALGYAGGSSPASVAEGVTQYDAEAAFNGLNLCVSGHRPEATLMDMDGNALHSWHIASEEVFEGHLPPEGFGDDGRDHWRRVYVFPNGDLLASHTGLGLMKLDKDSRLLWVYHGGCHHDIHVGRDGRIYTLLAQSRLIPRVNSETPVLEDYIVILDPDGKELRRISLLKAFHDSPFAPALARMDNHGDLFHTNTLEIYEGDAAGEPFTARRALVSVWKLNTIAVVDLDTERVVWSMTGMWFRQHQPTLLDNGNLLIFDNQGYQMASKVLEFDPHTQQTVWQYGGEPPESFYSELCGSCQRMPNGNTLITESSRGRAFEVTPDSRVVWEYVNPHRTGERNEFIANLFEVIRFAPEQLQFLEQHHAASN